MPPTQHSALSSQHPRADRAYISSVPSRPIQSHFPAPPGQMGQTRWRPTSSPGDRASPCFAALHFPGKSETPTAIHPKGEETPALKTDY
jgi:hypothetical protein